MGLEPHGHAGWIDRVFGLDPHNSFVTTGMDWIGYGPTGIFSPLGEDAGNLSRLGQIGGILLTLPLVADVAIGGHALDEINHGPSLLEGCFDGERTY